MSTRFSAVSVLALSFMMLAVSCQVGCKGVDPALRSADGRHLSEIDPIAYRVALGPIRIGNEVASLLQDYPQELGLEYAEPSQGGFRSADGSNTALASAKSVEAEHGNSKVSGAVGNSTPLLFNPQPEDLQQRLADRLSALRTSTELFTVSFRDITSGNISDADLILTPTWRQSEVRFANVSTGRAIGSYFLWLTTWVGGMFVPDCRYQSHVELELLLENPHGMRTLSSFSVSSGDLYLSYFDRNSFASKSTLISMLVPPFLTSDDKSLSSHKISEVILDQLSGKIARFLKEELPKIEKGMMSKVSIESPKNFSRLAQGVTSVNVRGQLSASEPIRQLEVYNASASRSKSNWAQIKPVSDQSSDGDFSTDFDIPVEVQAGNNQLVLKMRIGERWFSRCISVHVGGVIPLDSELDQLGGQL